MSVVHLPVRVEKAAKLHTRQNCCSVAPNLPLRGDEFLGIDDPGHATRLVATQQQDKALHSTTLPAYLLCSWKGVQAFNDKPCVLDQVDLPCKLPHDNMHLTKRLIFIAHGLDCVSLAGKSPASAWLERC